MKKKLYFLVIVLIVAVMFSGVALSATKKPMTLSELALYKGPDRQQILEEGARKEGKLTFYTTNTYARHIVNGFQKKYPYIKVTLWRAGTRKFLPRLFEEYKVRKYSVDVLGPSKVAGAVLDEADIYQPFYSPELAYIEEDVIKMSPGGGAFSAGHFQSGVGLGYNTNLIKKNQLPKTYQELLDPKWKGKLAIVGSETGVNWMAAILSAHGEEFLKQIRKQKFDVHMVSGRALNDMIIAGEYAFSPTIFDSHVNLSKKRGAPVDWIPLEPVSSSLNQIALPKHSTHPHAALLYIDFDLSKTAGEIYKAGGYNSPRKDIISLRPYKKYYGFKTTKEVAELADLFDKLFLKK
ncbi:ABC transporter substrate-binding protein [Thermodesulfobacteriota bacterium]